MSKEVFNGGEMTELNHLYSKREPLSSAPTSLNAANQKHDSRFPRAHNRQFRSGLGGRFVSREFRSLKIQLMEHCGHTYQLFNLGGKYLWQKYANNNGVASCSRLMNRQMGSARAQQRSKTTTTATYGERMHRGREGEEGRNERNGRKHARTTDRSSSCHRQIGN